MGKDPLPAQRIGTDIPAAGLGRSVPGVLRYFKVGGGVKKERLFSFWGGKQGASGEGGPGRRFRFGEGERDGFHP
jgi:hypothetical protein